MNTCDYCGSALIEVGGLLVCINCGDIEDEKTPRLIDREDSSLPRGKTLRFYSSTSGLGSLISSSSIIKTKFSPSDP